MFMFLGHLQVSFYGRPSNSELLFSKPGNTPIFHAFNEPVGPRGCVKSKSLIKQKVLRL